MNSVMTIPSTNDGAVVQYRDIDGHPVSFQVTIQRRVLTADGEEFRDGASEWTTCKVADIVAQVNFHGPVAHWLASDTQVDLTRLGEYPSDAPAYLWNSNAR
jgi:hypothetical protein